MSFKIHVVDEPWKGHTKLILIEHLGDQVFTIYSDPERGLVRTPLSMTTALEVEPRPFLVLDTELARHIFPAMIEAFSKKGFERPSESKIAGLYEAQSHHLKDLQTLLGAAVLKAGKLGLVILAVLASGCGSKKIETVCGKVVMAQRYNKGFESAPGAWIAVQSKNGEVFQSKKDGLWTLGMETCVEVER